MLNRRLIAVFLLVVVLADYDVGLVQRDFYNMGVGAFTGGSVTAVNTDDPEANFLAADQTTLRFYPSVGGAFTNASAYNVVMPENILQARFRSDGSRVAARGDTSSNNLYILSRNPTNFATTQTIDLGSHPNTLWWSILGDTYLAAGLANGTITVLQQNSSTGNFAPWRWINTGHTGGVARIVGKNGRIYSVGGSDQTMKTWWFNQTTSQFSLNQTLVYSTTASAPTAFHVSGNEKRVGIGRANGDIIILGRPDNNLQWTVANTLTSAHTSSLNFLRFTSNGWHLLSGATDGVVQLRKRADSWATPKNYSINGQSVDWDDVNKQYTIGTYGNNDGLFYTEWLQAANCTGGSVSTTDISRCNCPSGLVWFNGACGTLSCSNTNFTNINGTFNTTNSSQSCNCNTGYVWDETLLMCKRDCSSSATPNSAGSNYEYLSCVCNSGYQWDYTLAACTRYQNCVGMANSNGTNANSNDCFCNSGYVWNASWTSTAGGACQVDCANIARTNGFVDPLTCNCAGGYTWVSGSRICQLNCAAVPYSTGVIDKAVCKCQDNYRWDNVIGQCVSKTGSSSAVAIACGVAIPLGILGLLALLGLLWWCCRAPTPVPIPTPVPTPVATPVVQSAVVKAAPVVSQVARPVTTQYLGPVATSTARLTGPAVSGFGTPYIGAPIGGTAIGGPVIPRF